MPTPTDPADLDNAIELYLAGKTLQEIVSATGVGATVLHRERKARGIPTRQRVSMTNFEPIINAYVGGASEYGLSRQYGVSRGYIARVLDRAGVERRGMSEAGLRRNAGLTDEERRAQTKSANRAARMRRLPEIEKVRRALTVERTGRAGSEGEKALRRMLEERGQWPTVERAIGPYNVDLAVLPVAVEVLGGGFHGVKARHAERTPYILDAGWHLVMVWNHEGRSALTAGAADYVIAFIDEVRRNPPATCQYRVISGDGQLLATRGREDDEFPLVVPPRGRLKSGT